MILLGFDIGTSSIKAALVDSDTGNVIAQTHSPSTELPVNAPHPSWAEQNPSSWWEHVIQATQKLLHQHPKAGQQVGAIGISYQMHGLVLLDALGEVVRPAIIWSDSRATDIGQRALNALGKSHAYQHLLNAPGNFTASKLAWVKSHESQAYQKVTSFLLPGDYIAYRLSGTRTTTPSGLSEGTFWDFQTDTVSLSLLNHFGFDPSLVPEIVPNFGVQAKVSVEAASQLGIPAGTPITYRAGDQPNNALTLGVMKPGEVAATGGTSGVVYAVVDKLIGDEADKVNSFAHVNHKKGVPRIGVLLCINGAGSMYAWLRSQIGKENYSYGEMEKLAAKVPVGADDLRLLPFGNGDERMLNQVPVGANLLNLNFRRHQAPHIFRAGLEGIAFAFAYGMAQMGNMGIELNSLRVGNDNLFQSTIFSTTLADLTQTEIEVVNSTGAIGAAQAAGVALLGEGFLKEVQQRNEVVRTFSPKQIDPALQGAYENWTKILGILQ